WGHGAEAVETARASSTARRSSLLQWGHGAEAVETCGRFLRLGSQSPSFNGATARRPWKRCSMRPGTCPLPRCFNGAPARRPWKRRDAHAAAAQLLLLQWGPGAEAVETATSSSGSTSTPARFNGATARRPWKLTTSPRSANACGSLQWGHGAEAVETQL